ncbi:MAG: SIS domain-containing protein [Coraliomargaritaceae bacterium]
MYNNLKKDILELQSLLNRFEGSLDTIHELGNLIAQSLKDGGKLLAFGNGGSATDAMHLCEELVGRYKKDRKAIAAICLNSDVGAMTCIGNDYGYDFLFSRQIEALGNTGDVVIGFSTSGNSKNIYRAFKIAKELEIKTILVGGKGGGICGEIADYELIVPSQSTARIQEVHTFILHAWLEIIESELFSIDE